MLGLKVSIKGGINPLERLREMGEENVSEIIIHNTYFPLHHILTIKNMKHNDKTILYNFRYTIH